MLCDRTGFELCRTCKSAWRGGHIGEQGCEVWTEGERVAVPAMKAAVLTPLAAARCIAAPLLFDRARLVAGLRVELRI
jgi:hypothetical protein